MVALERTSDDTDMEYARRNLNAARLKLERAKHTQGLYPPMPWDPTTCYDAAGGLTVAWHEHVDRVNAVTTAQTPVDNLEVLFRREDCYHQYSVRRLGFEYRDYRPNGQHVPGELIVDGDWIVDMDGGSEYCLACTRKALLTGDFHPDSAHAFFLSIGYPDYTVECADCGTTLYEYEDWNAGDDGTEDMDIYDDSETGDTDTEDTDTENDTAAEPEEATDVR